MLRPAGPFLLDLGDVLYAPNCFRDGTGRVVMVGWMQEGASRDSSRFDYSGCLSLPRVLTQQGEPHNVLQGASVETGNRVGPGLDAAGCRHPAPVRGGAPR